MKKVFNIDVKQVDMKTLVTVLSLWAFVLIALLYIFVFILKAVNSNQELTDLQLTVTDLEDQVALVKSNKSISQNQLTKYNMLLTQLIPDTENENYFEVIAALERLSKQTGFTVSNYSIDLSQKAPDKYTLSVVGSGDLETFTEFLKAYQFGSGRLITISNFDFAPDKLQGIGLTLNFYHKKTIAVHGDAAKRTLTKQDIALMDDILSKTTVINKVEGSN